MWRDLALPRRALIVGGLAVVCGAVVTSGVGTTGPNQVSIASVGGYIACLTGIADGDKVATFKSIQGTRHPYQGAIYTGAGSVIGVSPQISNDLAYHLFEGASNMKTQRIDNQAAASGNGLYECKATP